MKKNLLARLVVLSFFLITIFLNSTFVSKTDAVCSEGTDDKDRTIYAKDIERDPKLESTITKCLKIDTAIGTIDTDPAKFTQFIYGVVLGLAGGIALIMIILAGYKFMTSQGNPEAVKAATEGLTSAIVGLLFIIFAFVILQIVGVDILRIPGFK